MLRRLSIPQQVASLQALQEQSGPGFLQAVAQQMSVYLDLLEETREALADYYVLSCITHKALKVYGRHLPGCDISLSGCSINGCSGACPNHPECSCDFDRQVLELEPPSGEPTPEGTQK